MRFDTPFMLFAAPAAGLFFVLAALWTRRVRIRYASVWSPELGTRARSSDRFGPIVLGAAALAAVLALAGPRWGSRTVIAESKALNMVIAIDVSRSMLARDVSPSRLERAKSVASRLVHDLDTDRIGLIAFAGESYVLSPLTMDGGALQLLVGALDPEISSSRGTRLEQALRQGRELLLSDDGLADRVLVVFTDGESHDSIGAVRAQASRIRRDGIQLILVSEGTPVPTRIPIIGPDGEVTGYYRDQQMNFIETVRRDDLLAVLADQAGGVIVGADLTDQAGTIRALIANLKRIPRATTMAARGILRTWIPLLVAIGLLLLHSFTRRTAALAVLALAFASPGSVSAQRPANPADEAWPTNPGAAARLYQMQVSSGEGGDTTVFNAGSAALASGDTALARRALVQASGSTDPGIRFKALYNLGLLHHYLASKNSDAVATHLEAAVRVYREALLLRPSDLGAKWNLELAIQNLPPSTGESREDERDDPPQREASENRNSGLSRSQAEQILNSIMQEERDTRARLGARRRSSREILGDREW